MSPRSVLLTALFILFAGVLYKTTFESLIFVVLGVGRVLQPISDFPYTCRRIYHKDLEACEDLWIDHYGRELYAACSSPEDRHSWMPMMRVFKPDQRGGNDHFSVFNIDETSNDGSPNVRVLKPEGYRGATGDQSLDLTGFDVQVLHGDDKKEMSESDVLRFFLVNHRPSVDQDGNLLDHSKVGANSTIEVFDVKRGENVMNHIKTFAHDLIWSPNKVAHDGRDGFFFTNDRSAKVGFSRELDFVLGGGNVGYCSSSTSCSIANRFGFTIPNGLVRGQDDLYYVPSSFIDNIRVLERLETNKVREVDTIQLSMPVDNLSVDFEGNIFAAGFPNAYKFVRMLINPRGYNSPSTAYKITKTSEGYRTEKILEDRDGEILGGITTVRHDHKAGKLFLSGTITPYIVVCDPHNPPPWA